MQLYQPILDQTTEFFDSLQSEPRRVFHGRGHMYPGLEHINLDWYPPVLLIAAYSDVSSVEALANAILEEDVHHQIETVIYQSRSSQRATANYLKGAAGEPIFVSEHGVQYEVQPGVNQNAGFFLDMRPLRKWLIDYSKGKSVLNLFAYTCSLSVAALEGGARQVASVDMSKPSIQWGMRNHELNDHDLRKVKPMAHNLFKSWAKIQRNGPYDTVIIDPPTRQRGSFDAEKDYVTILKKLHNFLSPGADIIATVNSPYLGMDFLPNLMQRHQSRLRLIGEFPASPEFEDRFPERGLKIFHFRGPS
jgi:23S rRNA (cytosine1962-C5)-methyltransferase